MRIKRKVWVNKGNGQKLVTVPFDSDVEDGDYVWLEKVKNATDKHYTTKAK